MPAIDEVEALTAATMRSLMREEDASIVVKFITEVLT